MYKPSPQEIRIRDLESTLSDALSDPQEDAEYGNQARAVRKLAEILARVPDGEQS